MPYQTARTEPRHVVVVDDDAAVRDILRSCLERECYRVSEASGGPALFAVMDKAPVHLITLDLGLAGEDGLAIARPIRSRSSVPIIMVTGKGDPIDRVVGLKIGADDYIAKPFHVREVLARVRSVLRRADDLAGNRMSNHALGEQLAFAGLVLNCVSRELRSPNGAVC
jgi:DNA-binding response OmpR family regulator